MFPAGSDDFTGRIALVHNGIIENADPLRRALAISGHHFASSVDSEVLCHLIEDQLDLSGDLLDAVETALAPLEGSWAVLVLEKRTGRIVIAAQQSPLRETSVNQVDNVEYVLDTAGTGVPTSGLLLG